MKINGFPLGMNNRLEDHALPGGALRNAVNIDIDQSGNLSRRDGYERSVAGVATHSGFACDAWTLFVSANRLKSWDQDGSVVDLMPVQGPVCFCELNGIVYFSDGVGAYKLQPDGSIDNWGVVPTAAPDVLPTSGALPAGRYLVAITQIGYDGTEHGASDLVSIDLPDDSGLIVRLPNVTDAQVKYLRTYVSTANGKVLYATSDTLIGGVAALINSEPGDGVELKTIGITAMPPCSAIQHYRGRMYARVGNLVVYSEELAYDRYRPSKNYIPFSQDVDILGADQDGLWIAADKTYYYAGTGPENFSPVTALEYGAVPGQVSAIQNTNDLMWYSTRGIVKASGGIANIQEANVAAGSGSSVALLVREHDGLRQAIASVNGASVSNLAAKSFIDMEVIRKAG